METDNRNIHDRSQERHKLATVENGRNDPVSRDFYWDNERWDKCLYDLAVREQASDTSFERQINILKNGVEEQLESEQSFDAYIQNDINWYERLLDKLKALRDAWQEDGQEETSSYNDLLGDIFQIEHRLHLRQIRLCQLWMENLERRRLFNGYLPVGQWQSYWTKLQELFADWDRFFDTESDNTNSELKLRWLRNFQERQQAVAAAWQHNPDFDQQGYNEDAHLVEDAITILEPPVLATRDNGGGGIVLGLIAVAFLIAIMASNTSSANKTPSNSPTRQTAEALNTQGITWLHQNQCSEAIVTFEQAVMADSTFYEPLNNMAFCLYEQGRIDEAITQWRRAIQLNSKSADANAGLGMALFAQGQQDEGIQYYQTAIQLEPNYRDPDWLRTQRFWSDRAIIDSTPIRAAIVQ